MFPLALGDIPHGPGMFAGRLAHIPAGRGDTQIPGGMALMRLGMTAERS
jgi:hypothetical protein